MKPQDKYFRTGRRDKVRVCDAVVTRRCVFLAVAYFRDGNWEWNTADITPARAIQIGKELIAAGRRSRKVKW